MRLVAFILVLLLTLARPAIAWPWGGNNELDFSSVEKMQKSVEEVTKDMSPDDKKAFGQALFAVLMEKNPVTGAAEPGLPQLMVMGQLGDKFYDGMGVWMSGVTVDEVKAKATVLAARKAAKADAAANAEAKKQKKAGALAAQQQCLNDGIVISNIHVEKGDLIFDITNNLLFAISGAHFKYVLKQEGRSVPISKDSILFSISGGVEPGETKSLSFYYHGPMGEAGKTFVETRMINVFDAAELPLLDTNTTYVGRPEGFSDQKCE
tara:strand:+ start:29696 stop:30490 length:795 start_codon:yes stop_codon:yes gene_type:complete